MAQLGEQLSALQQISSLQLDLSNTPLSQGCQALLFSSLNRLKGLKSLKIQLQTWKEVSVSQLQQVRRLSIEICQSTLGDLWIKALVSQIAEMKDLEDLQLSV